MLKESESALALPAGKPFSVLKHCAISFNQKSTLSPYFNPISMGHFLLSKTPLMEHLSSKTPLMERFISKTPLMEHTISMLQGESLSPAPNTDSFAVNATAGGGDTRLVLVDSGANTLYAESKRNLTHIHAAEVQITGVNGTSTAQRVGTLPPMVTNKGHPIFLNNDCVISNEQDIQNRTAPRTIVTPKHLNENGISVYFANGTTVLLLADTVELRGTVIHQEKFSDGLALIKLRDHSSGVKVPLPHKMAQPQLVVTGSTQGGMRSKLKLEVIAAALTANSLARMKTKPAIIPQEAVVVCSARSKFKMDKNSWERWHSKLGHSSLTVMRKALAQDPVLTKEMDKLTSTNCPCIPCLTTKVKTHPHNHGHAHLGGHALEGGERLDFDNSGMFATSVNKKRYRFMGVEYVYGVWFIYHAALKSEAPDFYRKTRSTLKALSKRDLRFIRTDSDSLFTTSKEMQQLYMETNVIPSFSPPYDHPGNSCAENGIRWLNVAGKTVFDASGTPSYLWTEVDHYCVHMNNYLPSVKQADNTYICRMAALRQEPTYAHDLELFYPFGCLVSVMIPKDQRKGPKHHDQEVGWTGPFVGYGLTTGHGSCLRVLNLKKRSIFTVSINFCTVIEDNFPFLLTRDDLVPISFIPTLAAYADQREWALYNFTPEEEDEVIAELSNENPKVWKSLFLPDTPTLPQTRTRSSASSIDPQATPPPRLEAMSPLTLPLSPPKRVELDLHEIDIDLSLDEEVDSQAPVAELAHPLTDTSQITPVIHRPQHHQPPVRQGLDPRRSARLASNSPIPFTTFTEEDIPPTEDIKESGIDGDSDSHEKCVVRGVKSAVIRLDVETGKNKFWYETQWEGHGEEANTYQLACDFDRHPATKAMLRAARDSRDASSAAAKTLEQPNQIYAIHRKSRGYMAKHIDKKFTRADLIFETIYDSIADPLPAHCVSSLAKANVLQENLYCKGAARRMIHAGLIPNWPHEQEPLTPPQVAPSPPP